MWRLALVSVLVTLIFFAAQAVVLAGTWLAYPGEYPDPFVPFEAMMPGQPAAAENCSWRYETTPAAPGEQIYCEIMPRESAFISVYADVSNARFVNLRFHANDLYVGDIVRHWGQPDLIVKNGLQFYVRWDTGEYAVLDAIGSAARFQMMQPLERVMVGFAPPDQSG